MLVKFPSFANIYPMIEITQINRILKELQTYIINLTMAYANFFFQSKVMSTIKRKPRAAEMQWVSVHAASTREPEIRFQNTLSIG